MPSNLALRREPEAAAVVLDELRQTAGSHRALNDHVERLGTDISAQKNSERDASESQARRVAERLALGLQASLMLRHAGSEAADAFVASRLDGDHGSNYGTLSAKADVASVLKRMDVVE